jgi:hypothetical protein
MVADRQRQLVEIGRIQHPDILADLPGVSALVGARWSACIRGRQGSPRCVRANEPRGVSQIDPWPTLAASGIDRR